MPEFPPLSPEGETSAPDDGDFPKACLKDLNLIVQRAGWRYGASFLFHSERWGDIWRIDFEIAGEDLSPRINRVMCWRTPADAKLNLMIAIGQDILPLERVQIKSIAAVIVPGGCRVSSSSFAATKKARPEGRAQVSEPPGD